MKPIVLVGHRHSCPIHGEGTVTTGSDATLVDGRPVARVYLCAFSRLSNSVHQEAFQLLPESLDKNDLLPAL